MAGTAISTTPYDGTAPQRPVNLSLNADLHRRWI